MDPSSAFLFELRGENPGLSRGLTKDKYCIGSHVENDLVLTDRGVAPHQVEIQCRADQFIVRNLSKEGAAFLNGGSFEESLLRKGDVLTLGDSIFRFVAGGEALTKSELWAPVGGHHPIPQFPSGRRNRLRILLGIFVAAVLVVVWMAIGQIKKDESSSLRNQTKDEYDTGRMDSRSLKTLYDRGVDLISAKRWDEAVLVFEKIRGESPGYKECDRLYKQAVRESVSWDILSEGQGLLLEGQLAHARAILEKVENESVYRREAEGLVREIDDRTIDRQLEKVQDFVALKDWASARALADEVPARSPADARANELRQQIEHVQASPGKGWDAARRAAKKAPEAPVGSKQAGKPGEPEKSGKSKEAVKTGGPAGIRGAAPAGAGKKPGWSTTNPSMTRAVEAYLHGDAQQSMSDLELLLRNRPAGPEADRARAMLNDVRMAKSSYHQAETLEQAGRVTEAVGMWNSFLKSDRLIAGSRKGVYFRKASVSLGRIFCRRGESAYKADDVVAAARFWRMAAGVDPENRDVRKGFDLLAESAQTYYRDGYAIQEINPAQAIEKWKVVLEIVPPADPYYKKARQRIERLAVIP